MSLSTQFEHELKKRIDEELTRLLDILRTRTAVDSFDVYHYLVGQIDALERVTESYCDEVNTILDKR